jgi:hypothetical protein
VIVEWETGETTYKPLNMIVIDDPVTCSQYAMEQNLIETAGWKRLKRIEKSEKKLKRIINQAKLSNY